MPSGDLNTSAFAVYSKPAKPAKPAKATANKAAKKRASGNLNKSATNISQFVNEERDKILKGNKKRTRSQTENVSAAVNTSANGKEPLQLSSDNAKQNGKNKGKKGDTESAEKQINKKTKVAEIAKETKKSKVGVSNCY